MTRADDAAGNVTSRGSDSFTWDWSSRLTGATVGSDSSTYTYDADGVRTTKTTGGATTAYLWDRQSGLPLVVDDGTNGYLHAGDVKATVATSGGNRTELLADALGSVRGSTDGAGTLTGTAGYDVFGDERGASTTGSLYGFTGEQTDPETGLLHLRARQYEPGTGRFLSRDSVSPNAPGTQGFHAYAYVANNPMTWVDPSGHSVADIAQVPAYLNAQWATRIALSTSYGTMVALGITMAQRSTATAPKGIGIMMAALAVIACFLGGPCLELVRYGYTRIRGEEATPKPVTVPTPGGKGNPTPAPTPGPLPVPLDCQHTPAHFPGMCPPPPPECTHIPLHLPGNCPSQVTDPCGPGTPDFPRHHIIPEKFRQQAREATIDIDQFTIKIPLSLHQHLHYPGWGGGRWNALWRSFFDANASADRAAVMNHAKDLLRRYGLEGFPICPHDGKGPEVELIFLPRTLRPVLLAA